jgi:hypothetical protein
MSTHGIKWASDSRNKMGQINIIKQAQLLGNWATSCINGWEIGNEQREVHRCSLLAVLHGCGSENLVRVILQLELAQIFIDIIIYGDILRD